MNPIHRQWQRLCKTVTIDFSLCRFGLQTKDHHSFTNKCTVLSMILVYILVFVSIYDIDYVDAC